MLPKIIHYCWLSEDPYPRTILKCIESWHKLLPEYEFKLWNTKNFDVNSVPWVKQAFEAKKYAFAADYIRLYALYTEGGIYLDSDVLVYKSFNDLLKLPYFIGQDFVGAFEPAIIGAERGLGWIKKVMDYYEGKYFINPDGSLNIKNLPVVFFEQLFSHYKFQRIYSPNEFSKEENIFNLFPSKFFNGRNNINPVQYPESYCSHLFAGSWTGRQTKGKTKTILPSTLLNFIYGLNYHFLRKNVVHNYDPIYRSVKLK